MKSSQLSDSYVMLIKPNKNKTVFHGYDSQGDMTVRMPKVLQTAGLVLDNLCLLVVCFNDSP